MFKFFWYKEKIDEPWSATVFTMEQWCYKNLGEHGKRWCIKYHVSPYTYLYDRYELKFKYREDHFMFKLCNL